jgi:hypothetical protein
MTNKGTGNGKKQRQQQIPDGMTNKGTGNGNSKDNSRLGLRGRRWGLGIF